MNNKYTIITLDPDASLPLVDQLVQKLTWMIASGMLAEGETLPNIRDMGLFLKVHMHTVRAAYHHLQDRGLVSMRPRVGTVVQKYQPFISPGSTSFMQQGLIAVLIPAMSPFYNAVFTGIQSVAAENHFLSLVIPCGQDPHRAESIYSMLTAGNFAGVINISLGFSDNFYDLYNGNHEILRTPLVFVDDFLAGTHRITINTADAIRLAAHHLMEHSYADIRLVSCPLDWPIGKEVFSGFSAALASAGTKVTPRDVFIAPDFSHAAGAFCAEAIIRQKNLPRALVFAGDDLALGAIAAFRRNGLHVPEEIAIASYNDIPSSATANPPLTTVALPAAEIGAQAMQSLIRIIGGKVHDWEIHTFSGQLIIRNSCGCSN